VDIRNNSGVKGEFGESVRAVYIIVIPVKSFMGIGEELTYSSGFSGLMTWLIEWFA